jgi:2-aminoadipate transaminase
MRLNFAGVPDDDIREGIRRIGKVVHEQLGLYGTLSGTSPARKPCAETAAPAVFEQPALADVVELPRRESDESARRQKDR